MRLKLLIVLFITYSFSFSQNEELKVSATRDAKIAADATLNENYDLLLKHTFIEVIEIMGGAENAKKTITAAMNSMKQQGFVFEKAEVISVSDIVTEEGQYRCYIENNNVMKMGDSLRIRSKSFLLGVYSEKEKIWRFIEAEKLNNIAMVAKILPNFRTSLQIPKDEMKMEKIE